MSDLKRLPEIIKRKEHLNKKHTEILILEKKGLIKAHTLKLNELREIEIKRIELEIDKLEAEIEELEDTLIIDVPNKENKEVK